MISIKLIAVDKKETKSENNVTRNTVTRNDNTETYIPKDIDLDTLKIGSAYLCYDKNANALKVYGANDGSMNLYALGDVAALGQSSMQGGGSGGGISYNRLDSWEAYDANKAGWVLSAGLGNDLNSRVASLENGQIEDSVTQEWVEEQGFATENWVSNNFNKYVLPVAGTAIGGVKSGTDITVDANGNVSVNDNSHKHKWENISDRPDKLPASDVSAWAKASTKPSYTLDEITDGSTRKLSNYVTAIGTSGNTLTWSKNGVAQSAITVPFATNATNATTATKLGTDAGSNIKPIYFSGGIPVVCNYQFGNNSGNAAVSNGTVCTDLNADKLDGYDGSYYATAADVKTLQGYFTNGVANKATKLVTPRTIWGQSFDGSANVSGAMTGVTSMDSLLYFNTTNNYIGIGNTSPNYKLDVTGVIHSSAGIFSDGYVSALGQNTSSDERLKDVQGDINVSIDVLANAPSKLFEWKDNKALGTQVGTIAQYWQRELPQVVHDRGDGYLTMQYDVTALLGVISVAKMVQNHEERIKKLEQENEALREQLKELKG